MNNELKVGDKVAFTKDPGHLIGTVQKFETMHDNRIIVHILPPGYNFTGMLARPDDFVLYDESQKEKSQYEEMLRKIEKVGSDIINLQKKLDDLSKLRQAYETKQ